MKWMISMILFPILVSAQNFHEIDAGKYFRSAQLSRDQFNKYIQKYKIKTVINLRGMNVDKKWYQQEMKAMADNPGVEHFDISMSAARLPHPQDLIQLLEIFKNAPKPLLVHCQAGVDRTGEASAIYTQEYMGWSKKDSLKMLSVRYGHIKAFKPAKSYFIDHVYQGEEWAFQSYNPCQENYKYYDKAKYCKANPDKDPEEDEINE